MTLGFLFVKYLFSKFKKTAEMQVETWPQSGHDATTLVDAPALLGGSADEPANYDGTFDELDTFEGPGWTTDDDDAMLRDMLEADAAEEGELPNLAASAEAQMEAELAASKALLGADETPVSAVGPAILPTRSGVLKAINPSQVVEEIGADPNRAVLAHGRILETHFVLVANRRIPSSNMAFVGELSVYVEREGDAVEVEAFDDACRALEIIDTDESLALLERFRAEQVVFESRLGNTAITYAHLLGRSAPAHITSQGLPGMRPEQTIEA